MSFSDLPGYQHLPIPVWYAIGFDGWSRKEARAFFDWFVGEVEDRIAGLQRVIGAWDPGCRLDRSAESLVCVGQFLMDHARSRLRTREELKDRRDALSSNPRVPSEAVPVIEAIAGDWALDEVTEYLCIDVGMYFAEVLRRAHPSLRWELWTYKTVEFHRPVIRGFIADVPLDPVGMAQKAALGFVEGKRNPARLRGMFEIWTKKVAKESTTGKSKGR